jgi:hypothetical protein
MQNPWFSHVKNIRLICNVRNESMQCYLLQPRCNNNLHFSLRCLFILCEKFNSLLIMGIYLGNVCYYSIRNRSLIYLRQKQKQYELRIWYFTSQHWGCRGKVSMCEYLPHINSSFVDLRTEDVLSRYTALHTVCLTCETGVTLAGFHWWWNPPAVSWSRPRCQRESPAAPQTAASHILPKRRAWAMARPLGAKPPCGSSPQGDWINNTVWDLRFTRR